MYLTNEDLNTGLGTLTTSQTGSADPPLVLPRETGWILLLKDGSYAIVVFVIILIFLFRKSTSSLIKEHMELVKSLRESNDHNTAAIDETVKAVQRMSKNNTVLTRILARQYDQNIDLLDDEGEPTTHNRNTEKRNQA